MGVREGVGEQLPAILRGKALKPFILEDLLSTSKKGTPSGQTAREEGTKEMSEPKFSDLLNSVNSDEESKRRYAQNSLIVDVALALNRGLSQSGMNQRTLADRLGKTEGFVSQVLSGGSNITIRTLGDFAYGLDCSVEIALRPH